MHHVHAVHHDWSSRTARSCCNEPFILDCCAGNYCQDVKLQKGAQYKLSYFYGRLMNFQQG